ncbi:pentatricopeptide repeat-containing protein At3g58590 isoform X1 [Ziziphus jujuba]|uniref:Pentatricopeptide repeat-containing protein At3g58590 isoform X1 n=3 Tax=Ziziphus jujuba TaxID=326968 RepID=A0A6P6G800_ZIZJJ|nr:pentatricopeptide repeat-containing protein At3g58590 isoform X1 [Ziziphus jujuba]XP_024930257.3 pentatricopeptide repeat-containing protein At3g58590 isoform X1 [Ziziphus jujuba]XP_048332523.2 pentatricopeptide repeat-containing protein At3g58590 isoform X1 [Ziziphus jujuba]
MSLHGNLYKHQERLLQLLHACSRVRSLKATKPFHALTVTLGSVANQTIFVYNNIMSQYVSLGELYVVQKVFNTMPQRNVVSYNTVIGAYSRCGFVEEAWKLFLDMRGCGFEPTQFTLVGLLSCESLDLCHGVQLQALAIKNGLFVVDAFVGTALLGLYGRQPWLEEAVWTFEDMPYKSLVTWNLMISLFGRHGFVEDTIFMFRELMKTRASLSELSFVAVLCGFSCKQDLEFGEQIHGLVMKIGFMHEVTVMNSLISMYVKCAGIHWAEKMFEEVAVRDVVSWNTIIGSAARSERPGRALELSSKMFALGVLPTTITYVNLLTCCTGLMIRLIGESIHTKIIKNSFESDVYVGSALVNFYAKRSKLEYAHRCFYRISARNVISWNALILGCSNHCMSAAVKLLQEMLQLGYRPNEYSFSAVLKSSLALELRQLHCLVIRMGFENNDFVLSSLITSYAKNGLISDALVFVTTSDHPLSVVSCNVMAGIYNRAGQYNETLKLLSQLEEPDSVSWNIVIAACARNNYYKEVFELYKDMHVFEICPNKYTFVSLLSVCAALCNLSLGSSVHGHVIKNDFNHCDTFLCNVLIDMYGKCGSVASSRRIFEKMKDRNLITWTALISALGHNGYAHEALERFNEMKLMGFKPDGVALNAVLTACRHGGLVKEGMELFGRMKESYGVEPEMDHYHCVVDLLAKYGRTREAEKIIANMPFQPNAIIWRSFLEGSKRHATAMDQVR